MLDVHQRDPFAKRHLGPRLEEIELMLKTVGYGSIDELKTDVVPQQIQDTRPLKLDQAWTESEVLDKLKEIKDLLDEKSQTLKRNDDKSDGRPKTKRDKPRDQRLKFCVRLRKEGHTWEKICRDYRAAIRKHKTYIDDPKASQDTLRQMCQQYHPELKE